MVFKFYAKFMGGVSNARHMMLNYLLLRLINIQTKFGSKLTILISSLMYFKS